MYLYLCISDYFYTLLILKESCIIYSTFRVIFFPILISFSKWSLCTLYHSVLLFLMLTFFNWTVTVSVSTTVLRHCTWEVVLGVVLNYVRITTTALYTLFNTHESFHSRRMHRNTVEAYNIMGINKHSII